jgi:hypothetical protein
MADEAETQPGKGKSGKKKVWRNACTVPIDLANGTMLAPDATIDEAPATKHDVQLVEMGMLVEEEA